MNEVVKLFVGADDSDELHDLWLVREQEGFLPITDTRQIGEALKPFHQPEVEIQGGWIYTCLGTTVRTALEHGASKVIIPLQYVRAAWYDNYDGDDMNVVLRTTAFQHVLGEVYDDERVVIG